MARRYISRAYVQIDGVDLEADEANWKGTKEQELKKTMNRQRRARGRVRGVPEYELTLTFSLYDGDEIQTKLHELWADDAEFTVIFEYEDGGFRTFSDSAINDLDGPTREGEGATITATMDAITMEYDPPAAFG